MITQSNDLQILKKEEVIATNDSQKDYNDLCCGDTITNNKLLKNDDKESNNSENFDAMPIERNDGSGDR